MRKSTLIVLGILVAAFALLMYLANSSLGMWRPDLEASQQLTQRFDERGDLRAGSKVKLRRVDGTQGRKGPGLNMEVAPSTQVMGRRGGLTALVRALALDALSAYPADTAEGLRWFKLTLDLGGPEPRVVFLDRPMDGSLLGPQPAFPATWPEATPSPSPPSPAIPGPPPEPAPAPAPGVGR